MKFSLSIFALSLLTQSAAFAPSTFTQPSFVSQSALYATENARREFIATAFTAAMSTIVVSAPAFADEEIVDDLAMPTEEEIKKKAVSFYSENLIHFDIYIYRRAIH